MASSLVCFKENHNSCFSQWLLGEMLEETAQGPGSGNCGLLWFSLEALENRLLVAMSSPRYAGCLR